MPTVMIRCCLLFALVYAPPGLAEEELIDRIVAVVDGYPILHSEVQEKVEVGPLVVVSDFPSNDKSSPYERALQDAINFELVMQKSSELEIEVRDSEVEGEIERFLKSRNLDKAGLLQYLAQQDKDYEEYKEDFRDQMIMRRFQGRVITPRIKITDKDVETFYLKKSGSTSELVELSLRQILIKIPDGASEEIIAAKQKLALEVHQKLNDGMKFEDAVKVYSDDEGARDTGGLMEGIRINDLAGQIRSEVESLEEERFTVPVRTALGFHLFYLEEKKFSGSQEYMSQKRNLEFELRQLELNDQTRKWLAEERQRSKVEVVP